MYYLYLLYMFSSLGGILEPSHLLASKALMDAPSEMMSGDTS